MTKVPLFLIYFLNFLTGILASFLLIVVAVNFFGVGIFGPPRHTPPLENRTFAVLLAVAYICLPIWGTKWLVSDSPYRFEYRFVSLVCFVAGVVCSFLVWQ
ncbi:hypothetical protein [Brevibacillus brevis]|uniref:Uncharacterized protein n=1 Tax=Brevibacillus brevis TaxID=1393 RepID=A0ABY9SZG7_BREBE|nr:hypothetical protein [Brevibacillus brevis]WNC12994.1 hypothetical protein RGB73_19990 [Brevibacillus brevis]